MNNKKFFKTLDILKKYVKPSDYNFHCEHDVMYFCIDRDEISEEDLRELYDLGCAPSEENTLKAFISC